MKKKCASAVGLLAMTTFVTCFSAIKNDGLNTVSVRLPAQEEESREADNKEERKLDRNKILSLKRVVTLPRRTGVPSDYLVFKPGNSVEMNVLIKGDGRISCQQGESEAVVLEPHSAKQFNGKHGAAKVYCSNVSQRELVDVEVMYEFEKVELSWEQADLKQHQAVEKALAELSEAKYSDENEKILTEQKIAFEGEVEISPNRLQTWDFGQLKEGEYVRFHSAGGEIASNDKMLKAGKGIRPEGIPVKLIGKDKKPQKDYSATFNVLPKNALVCYTENEKKEKNAIYVPGTLSSSAVGPAAAVRCTFNNKYMDKRMVGSYSVQFVRVTKEESVNKLQAILDNDQQVKKELERKANISNINSIQNALSEIESSANDGMAIYRLSLERERKLQEENVAQQKSVFGENLAINFEVGLKSFKVKATPVKKIVNDEVLGEQEYVDYRIASTNARYVPIMGKQLNNNQFEIEQSETVVSEVEVATRTSFDDPTAIEEEFIFCHDKIEEVGKTLASFNSQKSKVSAASVRFFLKKLSVADSQQCLGVGPKQKVSLALEQKYNFCMAKTKFNYQTDRVSKDLLAYQGITIEGLFSGTFAGRTMTKRVIVKKDKKTENAHPFFSQTIYSKIDWKNEADYPLHKCFESETIFPSIDRNKVFPELKKESTTEEVKE